GTTGILVSSNRAQHLHSGSLCNVRGPESISARPQPLPTSRNDRRRVAPHRPTHIGNLRYPACGFRNHHMVCAQPRTLIMIVRDPIKNFEFLWKTFLDRYPFFELRKLEWKEQLEIYRAKVTNNTNDAELFEIFCDMLSPLNDGHVELIAKTGSIGKRRHFRPEKKPRFHQEFGKQEIEQLFKTTGKTLADNGVELPKETEAWMLHYSRSREFGYIRILELEGVKRERLTAALDKIAHDFNELKGIIIDIRDNPGGDDSTAITIINRFCDQKRVAFHRKTKIGPEKDDLTPLKTWY